MIKIKDFEQFYQRNCEVLNEDSKEPEVNKNYSNKKGIRNVNSEAGDTTIIAGKIFRINYWKSSPRSYELAKIFFLTK